MEQFKSVLKSFKHPNSFLSLGEHFNGNKDWKVLANNHCLWTNSSLISAF
jgi:hypothetical protein